MAFRIEFTAQAEADFLALLRHFRASYMTFGETLADAQAHAETRVTEIRQSAGTLRLAPFRGTIRDDIRPGLRNVTLNRAILYFEIDEAQDCVQILAVFFGAQDHTRRMILRLLSDQTGPG